MSTEVGAAGSAVVIVLIAITLRPFSRRPAPVQQCGLTVADWFDNTVGRARSTHRRKQAVPAADVADWCDQLARRMRSGSTLRDALITVDPTGTMADATIDLRLGLERGQPIPAALTTSPGSASDPGPRPRGSHVDLAFVVIAIAARLGGSSATALDRVASSLRLMAADRQERSAQAAQARLSARVLTVVPLAMLALLVLTDDDVRAVVQAPVGLTLVVVGLTLNIAGWRWMRHIIGADK